MNSLASTSPAWYAACQERVNLRLLSFQPYSHLPELATAMETALLPGGKRLRPILALLCAECHGAAELGTLDVACAVECLHTASLVLDDLPAMDNAAVRHEQPALHRAFTPEVAVLTAHSLVSRAFQTVAQTPLPAPVRTAIAADLSHTVGANGMAAGQLSDLSGSRSTSREDILSLLVAKTGLLFRSCAVCGALSAGIHEDALDPFSQLGLHLGTAYQLIDDLRDADTEDLSGHCVNAAILLGESTAQELLNEELAQAQNAAGTIKNSDAIQQFISLMREMAGV